MNGTAAVGSMRLWRGGAFALASATCFGAGAPAAKLFVTQIDPWLMAGLLYAGAGTGLSVFWLARRLSGWRIARGAPLSGRGWWWFFGAAIAGGGFAPVLLMLGLARTPASTSSLLINLEVVLTVLIAAVVFGERIRGAARLGILAVILGGVILAWQGEFAFADPLGPLLVAGACLGWALDNNLTREIAHCDPAQIAVLRGLLAGALNVGLALLSGAAMPDAWLILGAGMLGLFSYGVPLVFFVLALRELGTSRTGTVFATAPFIGAIVSILALGEPADPRLGIAGACMALGLWLMLGGRLRRGAVEPGTSR